MEESMNDAYRRLFVEFNKLQEMYKALAAEHAKCGQVETPVAVEVEASTSEE